MKYTLRGVRDLIVAVFTLMSFPAVVRAQNRTEVTINDTGVLPENLTSSQDGTVYFGSTAKGTIYRAAPGAAQAEPWILASATGLTNVLGVLADDRTNTLWVCQNATGGRNGAPVVGRRLRPRARQPPQSGRGAVSLQPLTTMMISSDPCPVQRLAHRGQAPVPSDG